MIANDTDMVHKYTYDSLNRVTSYTDALGSSETYTYDNNQDMVKKVDRNGKAITYTYDGLHRMLTEKADGVSNSWTYGLTGGVLTETNDNAVKTYTYNAYGLPSTESTKIGSDIYKINRFYDTRGNNNKDHYYKNGTVYEKRQYVYDNNNRLSGVGIATGTSETYTRKVTYYYDKNDNLSSAHYDNNTYDVYYYNAANLIHCMDMVDKTDESKLEHLVYRYRLDGNMSGKTEEYNGYTTTTAYTYDSTGRLTKENVVSNGETFGIAYTYDKAGNRKTMTLSGYAGRSSEEYSYDKNNRLTSSVQNYGTTSSYTDYSYDKNGNQIKIEKYSKNNEGVFKLGIVSAMVKSNTGIEKFTYNGLNQLTGYESITGQYNGKAGLKAEYKYMVNGYRLSKSVNGLETRYLWDKDNVVAELNDMNVISQKYYRGCNLICDDSNNYYMHDIHGNIIEIYRGNNKYCNDWYIYNAFGTNKYFDDTSAPNKWGYCDQLKDLETGNYYMRARYYNPDTGRFISEDTHWNPSNMIYGDRTFEEDETKYPDITASLQAGNLYGYCLGNPIKYIDLDGFTVWVLGSNIAAQFGFKVSTGTGLCIDSNFNVGVVDMVSVSTGTSAGISLSESLSIIDTDSISDLNGASMEIGASISPIVIGPISFGGGYDATISLSGNNVKGSIYTISGSVGVGVADVHAQITYSKVQEGWRYVILQVVGGTSVRQLYSFIESFVS